MGTGSPRMRLACLLVIVHASLCATLRLREDHGGHDRPLIRIQAFVVNLERSEERLACMQGQLANVAERLQNYGVDMSFARYPALRVTSATVADSFKEYPFCYPSGSMAPLIHPSDLGGAWKGVLGNTCSHLRLLEDLSARANNQNGYYLILEDDIVFDIERFVHALKSYLELDQGHWSMLAFDTFNVRRSKGIKTFNFEAPEEDRIDGPLDLYLFSGSRGYWGAHAWLVHAARVKQFSDHLHTIPTMPLDWIPKWSSQLHTSFISYQSGSVWQRKYAPQDKVNTDCAYNATSDIVDAGTPRTVHPARYSESLQSDVVILGMYNSGTKLFSKLFQENIEKPMRIELCKNHSGMAYCGRVWKHTHPKRLSETISLRPDYGDFNLTVAVVIVRHPFSLIHSLQFGEDYDVHCGNPQKLQMGKSVNIEQSCYYVPPTGAALEDQMGNERIERPICPSASADKGNPICWGNVAEGWNSYMAGYLHDLGRLFKQVHIIRYEDLVQVPERTIRDLARNVVPEPVLDLWTPYEGSSKRSGGNRSNALQKFTEKNYGANFTEDDLKFLCAQLDIHLMGRLGYHGCKPALNDVQQVFDTRVREVNESGEQDQNDQGIYTSTGESNGLGDQDQNDHLQHVQQAHFAPRMSK